MVRNWSPAPLEGYTRHAAVAVLGVVLFVPGYVVQTLFLGLLSGEAASIVEPYAHFILAIGPALVIAAIVGWVVKRWYGTSTAAGVAAVLMAIYTSIFYAIEMLLTI